jgi:hypothetical protein
MPSVFTTLNRPGGPFGFEIDQGTVGLFPDPPGGPMPTAPCGFALAEPPVDPNNPFTTTEHWMLLPGYLPPHANADGTLRGVTLRPVPPAAIAPGLAAYTQQNLPSGAEFVTQVRAAYPGSIYLRASIVKQP